jgi:hypothetical protein
MRANIGIHLEVLMSKEIKSIRGLAKELTAIRRRPAPQEVVDEFNKIMEDEERGSKQQEEKKAPDKGDKKIAHPLESET